MKYHPIQIQFIMPSKSSVWARRGYRRLQHLIQVKGAVHLEITHCERGEDSFNARLIFKESNSTEREPHAARPATTMSELDLCNEDDVFNAAHEALNNPAYPSLKPNQRLYSLMAVLAKPVRVQLLCMVCSQIMHLRPETVRGALNKKRSLYLSPKHGIWCTVQLAEKLGLREYRESIGYPPN